LTAAGYSVSRIKATDVNFGGYNNANGLGVTCTVNGELFAFPDPNPLVMEMGEVVQWTTDNAHSHPLHTHTQPFQLTAFNLSNMYPGTALTSFFQVSSHWQWLECFQPLSQPCIMQYAVQPLLHLPGMLLQAGVLKLLPTSNIDSTGCTLLIVTQQLTAGSV
jgi:hypothetical protein